jgi:nucleoid-associated protein YgaU
MGLMDFFRKGKEQPIQEKTSVNVHITTQTASPVRDYTIKSGESLSKIAKDFYRNAGEWQKIYQANKDKIKDPNMIYPGQKIIIP